MRIEPTHFIEVWKGLFGVHDTNLPKDIYFLKHSLRGTRQTQDCSTVALFLIRPKTPQEREKSIYYPMLPTSMSETSKPTNNE